MVTWVGTTGDDDILATANNDNLTMLEGDDRVLSLDGDDFVDAGPGNDTVVAGDGNDTVLGGTGEDDITGGNDRDSLLGGGDDDTIFGGPGDDWLDGGPGDDRLEGGTGSDIAAFTGLLSDYEIEVSQSAEQATVTGPDGSDNLMEIESLRFEDRFFFLSDPDRVPGLAIQEAQTVAYLFEAALDRDGEIGTDGLNYWIDQRETGMTEEQLANAFLGCPEFEAKFGEALDPSDTDYLDDRALVERFYANILDRDPLQSGVDFWTDRLSEPDVSRANVLIAFATCAENVANSEYIEDIAEIAPGEWAFL